MDQEIGQYVYRLQIAGGGSCLSENWASGVHVHVHPSGNHVLGCGDDNRSIRVNMISNRIDVCGLLKIQSTLCSMHLIRNRLPIGRS